MKISFWIPAVVFYVVRVVFSNSVQVGTVLFTTTDLVKKCWTESDKSLLKARLIMQDVLPDPDCIDFSNPEAVAVLLDYFQACYQIIGTSTYGKLQNLMYLALSDALGGYLRAYVLPFTKRAYYAGEVKYLDAKKLYQLYDDIRVFLKTNGVGWVRPQKLCSKKFHVRPLVITGGDLDACKELYFIEKPGKLHCINTKNCMEENQKTKHWFPENPETLGLRSKDNQCPKKGSRRRRNRGRRFAYNKNALSFYKFLNSSSGSQHFFENLARKRSVKAAQRGETPRDRRTCSDTESDNSGKSGKVLQLSVGAPFQENGSVKRVIVPLPVLDDYQTPHSIAVPFLQQPLRNLQTSCSAFILEYYYLTVVKCFIAKGNSRSDIKNFNGQFHSWLVSEVIPHLSEEQWYPGFGGVLRVLQTIKKFGAEERPNDPVMHDIGFMFDQGTEFEMAESLQEKGKNKVRDVNVEDDNCSDMSQRHMILAIIIVSIIWLIIFCSFAFYCQATRGHKLLYEGHCEPLPSAKGNGNAESDNINLHFLLRFFKRDPEFPGDQHQDFHLRAGKNKDATHTAAQFKPCLPAPKRFLLPRRPENGDYFAFMGSLLPSALPPQPCLAKTAKSNHPKKFDDRFGREMKFKDRGGGDQVRTLWKKSSSSFENTVPSKKGREVKAAKVTYASTVSGTGSEDFHGMTTTNSCSGCLEDESKGYTTEKHSSTCYCSGTCPFAQTTTTTGTTYQIGEKVSSATMEFFEEIIAKHKRKKASTQDSTADSESECSTTSETDY